MTALAAPYSSVLRRRRGGPRAVLLIVHVLGAVGWIGLLTAVIMLGCTPGPGTAHLALVLTVWGLIPSAGAVCVTGPVLACGYRRPRPGWIRLKVVLSVAVVALAALVLSGAVTGPAMLIWLRSVALGLLLVIVVISVLRPRVRVGHRSGGRHRRVHGADSGGGRPAG